MVDQFGQQLDLTPTNSWVKNLHEVNPLELAECLMINTIAPFQLVRGLKPLLQQGANNTSNPKFIINVSSMEGKFHRFKTTQHPHTNMAKAALNMMTRTSALDFVNSHIYMNSVDTGWNDCMNPFKEGDATPHMVPPLDHVDGAARITDPIYRAIRDGELIWGQFLKNFKPTMW